MSTTDIKVTKIKITDLASLNKDKKAQGAVPSGAPGTPSGHNIVTIPAPKEQAIKSFAPDNLKDSKGIKYSEAMRGADLSNQRNARFRLNELTRGPLSVEAEEEARIEAEVQRRLGIQLQELSEITRKTAYQEGFEKGKQDARTEVLTASRPMVDQFEALVRGFDNVQTDIFKANEEYLIHMVYRLAKHVLLRELKEDTDYVRRLVSQLLERLGTRENIKIFVGETEYSSAETLREGLAQTLGQLKNLSIEQDSTITGRGCRLETDFGEIDARIEVQIENIAQTLGVSSS